MIFDADTLVATLSRTTLLLTLSALAAWIAFRLTRPSSPAVRRVLSALVLIQGVLFIQIPVELPAPLVHVGNSGDPQPELEPERLEAMPAPSRISDQPRPIAPSHAEQTSPRASPDVNTNQPGPTPKRWTWPQRVVAIWVVGMVGLVVFAVGGYTRFIARLGNGEANNQDWSAEWSALLATRGVRRSIPLQVAEKVGPLLCWTPKGYRLVVPAEAWGALDVEQRRAILSHELAHYERGDLWASLAVRLLALPHWFNPFAWWAVRAFDEAGEWACDDRVAALPNASAASYARALLRLSESCPRRAGFGPAARGSPLALRIRRLLSPHRRGDPMLKKCLLIGIAALLVVAHLVRPQSPNQVARADNAEEERLDRYGDPLPDGAFMRLGTVKQRLPVELSKIIYSHDGRHIFTNLSRGRLQVWDADSGERLHTLDVELSSSATLCPRERLAAKVDSEVDPQTRERFSILIVTDVETGEPVMLSKWVEPLSFSVEKVAFAPDGDKVATLGGDGTLRLWDVATGREVLATRLGERGYRGLTFSPDGNTLAASTFATGAMGIIHLLELDQGGAVRTLSGHERPVRDLAFSPDGTLLASAAEGEALILWEVESGRERNRFQSKNQSHSSVEFSPDGKWLAAAGGDGFIPVWDVATGRELYQFETAEAWSGVIAFAPDGKSLASNGGAGVLHIWDLETGQERFPNPESHRSSIEALLFTDDGATLITGAMDSTARVWDVATGTQRHVLEQLGFVRFLAIAPDGATLATAALHQDAPIQLWDLATGRELHALSGHGPFEAAKGIGFSPDGKALLSCGRDGAVRKFDVATGQEQPIQQPRFSILAEMDVPQMAALSSITRGWFSPDGTLLAVANFSHLAVADLRTGEEQFAPIPGYSTAAFSPDSTLLAIAQRGGANEEGEIRLLELPSGRVWLAIPIPNHLLTELAFAPDGRTLAVSQGFEGGRGRIQLFDVADGREMATLGVAGTDIDCLAFSPGGDLLASGQRDTTALIWEVPPRP